ncbi:MAG: helix-turn-helix domain-containing protein [Rhodospirillaceae bacterium]
MDFGSWIDGAGLTMDQVAEAIGVGTRMTVWRYRTGRRIPPREVMARILALTGGAVTPNDFYAAHDETLTERSVSGTGTESGTEDAA